jgi:hypothetical protein
VLWALLVLQPALLALLCLLALLAHLCLLAETPWLLELLGLLLDGLWLPGLLSDATRPPG